MNRRFVTAVLILVLLVFLPLIAFSQEDWKSVESDYCSIQYYHEDHLREFARRIGAVRHTSTGLTENISEIRDRVDEIVERVQWSLDMYPEMKISVVLYPDHSRLGEAFRQFTEADYVPLAFYAHGTRTVYTDSSSVTPGVLAHELAHAVINHFFIEPPPSKTQEILARYVDRHLWD